MHARDLLDLAVVVAEHGPLMAQRSRRLSAGALEGYWTAAKSRLDRWHRTLRCGASPGSVERRRRAPHHALRSDTIQEILASEPLTRVWMAAVAAHDRRRRVCEAEAVARSVYIGHLEARHRALSALSQVAAAGATGYERIDLMRRRAERWTDVLVARFLRTADVAEFSVDPERCRLFADDFDNDARRGQADQAWQIMAASLRAGMRQISLPGTPNSDLNARIAVGIIACFEPDLFSDSGCLPALWQARLTAGLVDVQGMVEDLLGSHPRTPEAPHSPAPHDWSAARRPPGTSGPLSSGRF